MTTNESILKEFSSLSKGAFSVKSFDGMQVTYNAFDGKELEAFLLSALQRKDEEVRNEEVKEEGLKAPAFGTHSGLGVPFMLMEEKELCPCGHNEKEEPKEEPEKKCKCDPTTLWSECEDLKKEEEKGKRYDCQIVKGVKCQDGCCSHAEPTYTEKDCLRDIWKLYSVKSTNGESDRINKFLNS